MPNIGNAIFIGTNAQVGANVIETGNIKNSEIINDDISPTAAIAASKLSGVATSGANTNITSLGGLTTPLTVEQGGTERATIDAHKVLVGADAAAIAMISPDTAGKVLTSNGVNADPSFQTPSGGVQKLQLVTTPVTVANPGNGNPTSLGSFSLPGGSLSTNNAVRVTFQITAYTWNTASNLSFALKYGATTIGTLTANKTSFGKGTFQAMLYANAATNAQKGNISFVSGAILDIGTGTAAEDSTADKTIDIIFTPATSNAGDTITVDAMLMEVIK